MKKLQVEFKSNVDLCGLHTFKQIKTNGIAAIYQRIRSDGTTHSFEAFKIKVVKAGAPLPNGTVVLEDYQPYPGKSVFGKTAFSCKDLVHAEIRYDEICKNQAYIDDDESSEVDDEGNAVKTKRNDNIDAKKGRRGRKAKEVKMPIPKTGEKFTMKMMMAESGECQPILYIRLKMLIEQNKVVAVGEAREPNTRGKAQIVYLSNTDEFVNS
jgi:hypothetical protein